MTNEIARDDARIEAHTVSEAPLTKPRSLRHYDRDRRLAWIELYLGKYSTKQLALRVAEKFEISERMAYADIAEIAERARSDDAEEHSYRVAAASREWMRKSRKYEREGRYHESNYAYDKACKLKGLYAPKKIEVSGSIGIGAQITTLVGILDAEGLKALDLIQQQIAAARAKGQLSAPTVDPALVPIDVADEDDEDEDDDE